MKALIYIFILVSLVSCAPERYCYPKIDKEKEQAYFFLCLKSLSAGPTTTKYNDWEGVIDSCGRQANNLATVGEICKTL